MKGDVRTSLLFEIGVEEIPSGYFEPACASILAKGPALLAECGWVCEQLQVETTPRRFVIYAHEVRPMDVQEEERLGPVKDQAYQDGRATPALLGFLRSVNRIESDVYVKETPRGPRVAVKLAKERKPLRYFFEILPSQLPFPKMMRWEKSGFSFSRPIRWTFAFVGTKLQRYRIADVPSSNATYGHRFLHPGKIQLKSADYKSFQRLLARHHVLLSTEERIAKIKQFLRGSNNQDDELVRTVAHLVEEPFRVAGRFHKSYLNLPPSVLTTCMSKHQRIFACYDRHGRLENRFVAIINGPRKNRNAIAERHESVLTSRLNDAQFFFQEDRKTTLKSKVDKLKDMMFLGSLGSYRDKTKRLEATVQFLASEACCPGGVIQRAVRAAHLAKADLTSRLVYEFPELQGVVGSEYARLEGEEVEVSRAIMGHYVPMNLSEEVQNLKKKLTPEGALVGLCDRMDLLVGAIGLGIEPTSSEDPYALKRAAGGIVKIIRAHPFRFSFSKWVAETRKQFGGLISKSETDVERKLRPFVMERIIFELALKPGTSEYELLAGIFAAGFDSIADVFDKYQDLMHELDQPSFLKACKVMERTGNILKGVKEQVHQPVDAGLFQDPLERTLMDLIRQEEGTVQKLIQERHFGSAAKRYGAVFYQPVHDFFDQVLVNHENSKIRTNRQALVKKVNMLCAAHIADLSLVQCREASSGGKIKN